MTLMGRLKLKISYQHSQLFMVKILWFFQNFYLEYIVRLEIQNWIEVGLKRF